MPLYSSPIGSPPHSSSATSLVDPRAERRGRTNGNGGSKSVNNRTPETDSASESLSPPTPDHLSPTKPNSGMLGGHHHGVDFACAQHPQTTYPLMAYPTGIFNSNNYNITPTNWSMPQIEDFFISRGYIEEIEFIRQAEFDTQQAVLFSGGAITPVEIFSLKLGLKLMEIMKSVRKLVEDAEGSSPRKSPSSPWGDDDNSMAISYGNRNSYDRVDRNNGDRNNGDRNNGDRNNGDRNSGDRRRGGGGRGGSRDSNGGNGGGGNVCFNCNESGHFSRECPKKGEDGGRGGRRGGGRGGRGGGRNSYGTGANACAIGGGGDWGDDNRPSKRPRTSYGGGNGGGDDDWGSSSTPTATTAADDDDWETPSSNAPVQKPAASTTTTTAKSSGGGDDDDDWATDTYSKTMMEKKPNPPMTIDADDWETDEPFKKPSSQSDSKAPAASNNKNNNNGRNNGGGSKPPAPTPPKAADLDDSDSWE